MTEPRPGVRILRALTRTTSLSALAALWAVTAPANGQEAATLDDDTEQAAESITLDTILVEALRMSQPAAAVPNAVTIIDEGSLDTQRAVSDDLSTILGNLVPNFSPSRQKLTNSSESLRGRSPLFLIDGVPQSNPLRDGSRDGHTIDPDLLERVEVINGSSAIQGLGALGGIVNLQTRDLAISEDWTSLVKAKFTAPDDFETNGFGYKGVALTGRKWGRADITLGATYERRGLYYDGNDKPIGLDTVQGDLADSESRDLFLKAGYNFTADQRLQLMVNDFRLRGDGDYVVVPGDRDAGRPTTVRKGDPEGDAPENDVTTISLDYRHDALWNGQLRAQAFYQRFDGLYGGGRLDTFQDPDIAPPGELFDQSQNESRKHGAKLSYSHNVFAVPGLTVTGGVDYLEDETRQVLVQTDREWVPETTFRNWAPFMHLDQELFGGTLLVSGGLRYESAVLKVDDYTTIAGAGGVDVEGGSPSFDELLPDIGAVLDVGHGLSVYASYSRGFTMPDVGRVLRAVDTPGQNVDDLLTLEPVIADNREIGIDFQHGPLALHAAYFWSDSDLGMRLQDVGGVFEVRREKTEIEGFELSAGYDITEALRVGAIYSLIRGKYDSDDDGEVDTDLGGSNINPDRLNLFAEWSDEVDLPVFGRAPLFGRLQVSHFFDRDFDGDAAPEGQDFAGYTLVDLSMGTDTAIGTFSLGVENLLDEQYITYYSQTATDRADRYFAGRGRTLMLTYETRL